MNTEARKQPLPSPAIADSPPSRCIAFNGVERIATGTLGEVAIQIKRVLDSGQVRSVLCFDASTSEQLEVDTRGSIDDVTRRYPGNPGDAAAGDVTSTDPLADVPRARGRPRLGVVAREVTLLPRHWDWLASQPGGASVALRKLVEDARRTHASRDLMRKSREVTYKFMSAIAGNLETFEEATRALFAGDRRRLELMLASWPVDVRDHVLLLARDAFG